MATTNKKENRGGARIGAGRKALVKGEKKYPVVLHISLKHIEKPNTIAADDKCSLLTSALIGARKKLQDKKIL